MECMVCSDVLSLPPRFEAPCSVKCGRVCHIACADKWLSSKDEHNLSAHGMRLMDCACGAGVFAPICAICGASILPPAQPAPTCSAPCGRVLAHASCIAAVRGFRAQRICNLCNKPWCVCA
mmetsp:Transcript_95566/g.279469  ORF Transcript_95566/g.279469 Transcript_95566/m.279469 type:complete len:121 (+) Transcript_95566:135-497(+)